jgi:hypothetical protein
MAMGKVSEMSGSLNFGGETPPPLLMDGKSE